MPDPLPPGAQSSPPPASAPPGWHPDPRGLGQRWWDGSRWTEHTSGAAQAAVPGAALASADARTWATAAHLSALVGLVVGFSFIGPLVVYLIKRDDDPFVREHAAEALNFNLSVLIYGAVALVLTLILLVVLVGILLIPVLIGGGVAWLVLVIVAAMKANRGEAYRYPLTIRFLT